MEATLRCLWNERCLGIYGKDSRTLLLFMLFDTGSTFRELKYVAIMVRRWYIRGGGRGSNVQTQ